MTISIVARTPDARLYGIAIASSSPAVAARCVHARAGVGAVASQNVTDPALGAAVLDRVARGAGTSDAVTAVLAAAPYRDFRQIVAIGRSGPPAIHSGANALGIVGSALGEHSAAAGNLLANSAVPAAMVAAFESEEGHLGARLLTALRAGVAKGGEVGPVHSAGLLVVRDVSWPIVDLRVDWHQLDPIGELARIWDIYAPQIDDYVARALNPDKAPRFGVPGDP